MDSQFGGFKEASESMSINGATKVKYSSFQMQILNLPIQFSPKTLYYLRVLIFLLGQSNYLLSLSCTTDTQEVQEKLQLLLRTDNPLAKSVSLLQMAYPKESSTELQFDLPSLWEAVDLFLLSLSVNKKAQSTM